MGDSHEPMLLQTRARITATVDNYDGLLDIAKSRAPDPSVFDEYAAAFWTAIISSNRVDYYKTAMAEPTLKNYVRNLQEGISFQGSHEYAQLGFGQSIAGELIRSNETVAEHGGKLIEVNGTFMTLSGVQTGAGPTDDFLAMIRAGGWKDVSVGFYAYELKCSICGQDPWDWDAKEPCTHLAGLSYDKKLAFYWIMDGQLTEVSQVYDGASPNAMVSNVVTKAQTLADARLLTDRQITALESIYQREIKRPSIIVSGFDSKSSENLEARQIQKETPMGAATNVGEVLNLEDEVTPVVEQAESIVAPEEVLDEVTPENPEVTEGELSVQNLDEDTVITLFDENDDPDQGDDSDDDDDEDVPDTIDRFLTPQEIGELAGRGIKLGSDVAKALRGLTASLLAAKEQIKENAELAEVGKAQRELMVKETLRSGVRAMGTDFDQAVQERILNSMSYEDIVVTRDMYEKQVENRFKRRVPAVGDPIDDSGNEAGGEKPARGVNSRSRYKA